MTQWLRSTIQLACRIHQNCVGEHVLLYRIIRAEQCTWCWHRSIWALRHLREAEHSFPKLPAMIDASQWSANYIIPCVLYGVYGAALCCTELRCDKLHCVRRTL